VTRVIQKLELIAMKSISVAYIKMRGNDESRESAQNGRIGA
jgi:hypothetical protein